jgi:hypothetical protein
MAQLQVDFPHKQIASFCRRNQIRRLSVFGSALRDDFAPHSDIDVLVEFEPEARIGFMALGRMRRELSEILGRPVDLVPHDGLKSQIREAVLSSAEAVYAP